LPGHFLYAGHDPTGTGTGICQPRFPGGVIKHAIVGWGQEKSITGFQNNDLPATADRMPAVAQVPGGFGIPRFDEIYCPGPGREPIDRYFLVEVDREREFSGPAQADTGAAFSRRYGSGFATHDRYPPQQCPGRRAFAQGDG
jgi:hypothetical protein